MSNFTFQLTGTHLSKLGKNVKCLKKSDIETMNADDLATTLNTLKDTVQEVKDEFDVTSREAIIEKVRYLSSLIDSYN